MPWNICFNLWLTIGRSRSWRRIARWWHIICIGFTISSSTGALKRNEHGRALGGPRLSIGSKLRYKHRGTTLQRRLWSCTKRPWLNSWLLWSQQYRRRLRTKLRGHISVSLLLLWVSFQYLRGRVAAAWAKVQTETLRHSSSRPTAPVPTMAGCFVFPSGSRPGLLKSSPLLSSGWLDDWSPFFFSSSTLFRHTLPPPPFTSNSPRASPQLSFPQTGKKSRRKNPTATAEEPPT